MAYRISVGCLLAAVTILLGSVGSARAEVFGGIDFPAGSSSFADGVKRYDALFQGGPGPTDPDVVDPLSALGPPDYDAGQDTGYVTLGRGGILELLFTDNVLTNSGSAFTDLHVFEIGPDVEDTFVAIRPEPATLLLLNPAIDVNGDGFFKIGKVFGATSSIDIDAVFPGFAAGLLRFDAVQLVDDPNEGQTSGETVGADIDSVGAIASAVPEPESGVLAAISALGVWIGLAMRRRPLALERA